MGEFGHNIICKHYFPASKVCNLIKNLHAETETKKNTRVDVDIFLMYVYTSFLEWDTYRVLLKGELGVSESWEMKSESVGIFCKGRKRKLNTHWMDHNIY